MKIICCLFCVLKSMKYSTIYKKEVKEEVQNVMKNKKRKLREQRNNNCFVGSNYNCIVNSINNINTSTNRKWII